MNNPSNPHDQFLRIQGARVFSRGRFHEEEVYVSKGRFVKAETFASDSGGKTVVTLDAAGSLMLPGLTDIHMHGAVNHDLCDGSREGIEAILRYEAAQGVTQVLPTSLTVSADRLDQVFSVFGSLYREGGIAGGAMLAGLHMEGPYINASKRGAQNPAYIRKASMEEFKRLNRLAADAVRILSLAPETEGALACIAEMKEYFPEVLVSLAHTTADYATAAEAFAAGASHVTHLFNAMPPLHHREPGLIGAAIDTENVSVEVIADGVHLHPSVIRAAFRLFPGRVTLISDSMRAAGLQNGRYDLGGQNVTVRGRYALLDSGSIAGSVTTLYDCLRFAVACGIPLEDAVFAASEYPASVIGIAEEAGTIQPGRRAHFVLARPDLTRLAVYLDGVRLA